MKKRYLAAILLSLTASLPAVAGPDWQIIHDAERYALRHPLFTAEMPLDHGSRALSTPYEKQSVLSHEQDTTHKLAEHKDTVPHNQPHG